MTQERLGYMLFSSAVTRVISMIRSYRGLLPQAGPAPRAPVDLELQDDFDMASLNFMSVEDETDEKISYQDLLGTLAQCKKKYSGVVLCGIEALELKSVGFTTGEIAKKHGTTVNSINAWISKARASLREDPDFLAAIAEL